MLTDAEWARIRVSTATELDGDPIALIHTGDMDEADVDRGLALATSLVG